jgi:uncharacterized membrane protein YdjX (TVP38/TMEM64 family)
MKNRSYLQYILLAIIIFFTYQATQSDLVRDYASNPAKLQNLVLGFGILAPLAVILLQTFQSIISIIPSQLTTIIAGFIFGPFWGLVYSLIGATIGSSIVFLIGRKYGKDVALKFFEKKEFVHFHLLFKKKQKLAVLLARTAPIFPNDLVSIGAGLTTISFKNFTIISTIGFILQMLLLSFFGAELATGKVSSLLIIFTTLISLAFLVFIFKEKLKRMLIKDIHLLEKEGRTIEHKLEKEFRRI